MEGSERQENEAKFRNATILQKVGRKTGWQTRRQKTLGAWGSSLELGADTRVGVLWTFSSNARTWERVGRWLVESWLSHQEHWLLFPRTRVRVPAPSSSSSPSVTPVPGAQRTERIHDIKKMATQGTTNEEGPRGSSLRAWLS